MVWIDGGKGVKLKNKNKLKEVNYIKWSEGRRIAAAITHQQIICDEFLHFIHKLNLFIRSVISSTNLLLVEGMIRMKEYKITNIKV